MFVSDVPMFTPMMIGIAGRTGSTIPSNNSNKITTQHYIIIKTFIETYMHSLSAFVKWPVFLCSPQVWPIPQRSR